MKNFKLYFTWFIKIIISLLFILASLGKLSKNERVIQMFSDWGYFEGFYLVIGVIELVLAILLLIPRTSLHSAIVLFGLMIGALITHLLHDPIDQVLRPLIFMSFLAFIIYAQWDKNSIYFLRKR